jgi:hypothetical protein
MNALPTRGARCYLLDMPMMPSRVIAACALAIVIGLDIVGVLTGTLAHHVVQTLPLWPGIVLGMTRSRWTAWAAIPCCAFWLLIMAAIQLSFLHVISLGVSVELAPLTIAIAVAAAVAIVAAARAPRAAPRGPGAVLALAVLGAQLASFQLGFHV